LSSVTTIQLIANQRTENTMTASGLPIHLIGVYQDAFMRKAGPDGSVDSSQVSGIMKSIGQNPSDAEIQVQYMASKIS